MRYLSRMAAQTKLQPKKKSADRRIPVSGTRNKKKRPRGKKGGETPRPQEGRTMNPERAQGLAPNPYHSFE